jgi:hypothetical protein
MLTTALFEFVYFSHRKTKSNIEMCACFQQLFDPTIARLPE